MIVYKMIIFPWNNINKWIIHNRSKNMTKNMDTPNEVMVS